MAEFLGVPPLPQHFIILKFCYDFVYDYLVVDHGDKIEIGEVSIWGDCFSFDDLKERGRRRKKPELFFIHWFSTQMLTDPPPRPLCVWYQHLGICSLLRFALAGS